MSNQIVTIEEVQAITTPEPTDTWQPIPHGDLLRQVGLALTATGYRIETQRYELDADGLRMFATWAIINGVASEDHRLSVGIRNAHDKAFAVGVAFGTWVLVCSNLEFGADYVLGRKHTSQLLADLPGRISDLMGNLDNFRDVHERRLEAYKRTDLDNVTVHDVLIRSVDERVMATSYIAKVLQEWREPQHEEFEARTAWSLLNAYTEVFKGTNTFDLSARTRRLHGILEPLAVERGNDPSQITLEIPSPSTALVRMDEERYGHTAAWNQPSSN